jgi:hypothetical protein
MNALSSSELLAAWEEGLEKKPFQKALILLASACPEASPDSLARLSIGQRDSMLLTLRELTFGLRLTSIATCQRCKERLELIFSTDDIRVALNDRPLEDSSFCLDGYEVCFRLPNSLDLADLDFEEDPSTSRDRLLGRILLSAKFDDHLKTPEELPDHVKDEVSKRMEQLDPQADIRIAVTCPSCGHQWEAIFDIVSFFWSEINAWAYRILREVHNLALAYGWQESEILALSPLRRQIYLEMAGV